jgi:4-phytase / acid phosphatase
MSMTIPAAAILGLLALAAPLTDAAGADEVLRKVVIVSRHGVRTPTSTPVELANWAAQPWPTWNQPTAALTPRGAELATLMGHYYRQYVAEQGVVPGTGCPAPGSVYFYADVLERTKATAQALIDGFAPGCGITYRMKGDVKVDPLFHPLEAGVCKVDPMVAQTRVLERAGGDLNRLTGNMKPALDVLQTVLDCCKPALCTAWGRNEQCKLGDLPTVLSPRADGSGLELLGALAIASTTSELLLLEYSDGMPAADVGWGRATPAQIRDTLPLNGEQFDLMERTPYLARKMGSSLLSRVGAAVTSARQLGFGVLDPAVRQAKFVAYVGHDTNIWQLASMLDVTWLQPGYSRNQTPPAGALMFEVREGADKRLRVYTSYLAQSIEQMRNVTTLTVEAPPQRTALRVPGCSANAPGFPCTLEGFAATVRNVLDRDCVQ